MTEDRWSTIANEMTRLAKWTPDGAEEWQLSSLREVVSHHLSSSRNSAYRDLVATHGIAGSWRPSALTDLSRLPIVDKYFLSAGNYLRQPASDGPVTIVETTGTTRTAVSVPHNAESIESGLGDNFARAFIAADVGADERFWVIAHSASGIQNSGSLLSMRWLQRTLGAGVMLSNSHEELPAMVHDGRAFEPTVLASSPNILSGIARQCLSAGISIDLNAVLYGGAAASESARSLWNEAFRPKRVVAFLPTTDAGALGVSPKDDDVYACFTETHLVEIVDHDGRHVQPGEDGDLVVTAFQSLAAPVIRYRVGDRATYQGTRNNRALITKVRRIAEAAIGDSMVPFSDIESWTDALHTAGYRVAGVQLVCRLAADGRDQPVIRVINAEYDEGITARVIGLFRSSPQMDHEIEVGAIRHPEVEYSLLPEADTAFKIRPFVDERPRADTR